MGQYRLLLFGDLPKLKKKKKKKIWHFEIFLTQDHMQLEISKCYFSHNFPSTFIGISLNDRKLTVK